VLRLPEAEGGAGEGDQNGDDGEAKEDAEHAGEMLGSAGWRRLRKIDMTPSIVLTVATVVTITRDMKNVANAKRLPKFWTTMQNDALTMDRFEFVALFVAYNTKSADRRALVGGYQVVKTDAGWVYGFESMGPMCQPCDAAKLFDMIRRTNLCTYTQYADQYRIDVHMDRRAA
jgi:hypothetical protein